MKRNHNDTAEMADRNAFTDMVKETLQSRYPDAEIHSREKIRNNGFSYTGICIMEAGRNAAPIIALDDFYQRYREGEPISAICETIGQIHEANKREYVDIDRFRNLDAVKERICWKLVNMEKNRELLQDIPFVHFLDLAVIFYLLIEDDADGISFVTINNRMMQHWKMDEPALLECARENTPKLLPVKIQPVEELIAQAAGEDPDCPFTGEIPAAPPIYVSSNESQLSGAAVVLYDGVLQSFAEVLGSSYYLIFSSIHEALFLPDLPYIHEGDLLEMVQTVNAAEVSPEEVLSDHVYYYEKDTSEIKIITG